MHNKSNKLIFVLELRNNKRELEQQEALKSPKPTNIKVMKLQKVYNSASNVTKHYIPKLKKQSMNEIYLKHQYDTNKIFSSDMEEDFKEYIAMAFRLHQGQSPDIIKKLAYQFAQKHRIKTPPTWSTAQMADDNWLLKFCKRHPYISFQRLEDGVEDFFNNLSSAYRHLTNMHKGCVYNFAEIAFKTTHNEYDTFKRVTACCFVNASGRSIPPFLVFPGFDFKPLKLGAPAGSLSAATIDGCVNGALFIKILEHFVKFSKCSKDKPIVLIADYHEKYITLDSLEFARENGVIFMTVPLNNVNELQPLHKIVFHSLRRHYDNTFITYDQPVSLNTIDQLFWKCYHKAFTAANIENGFKLTGIWPFNRNLFF